MSGNGLPPDIYRPRGAPRRKPKGKGQAPRHVARVGQSGHPTYVKRRWGLWWHTPAFYNIDGTSLNCYLICTPQNVI